MKSRRTLALFLCVLSCSFAFAQDQSVEKGLAELTTKLSSQITNRGKKKVTVLDFTDLQGGSSELGRYLAEELTVNLVIDQTNFSVLDRANLKSILAEHKLTATGLVDPENAKKLGQFAGVDALILGTIIPMNESFELTAKMIATDTAVIAGAARIRFKADHTTQQLVSKPTVAVKTEGDAEERSKVTKSFGDLRVELKSLKVANGKDFLLTVLLANQNPRKSIWVALNTDLANNVKGTLTDAHGFEFQSDWRSVSGLELAAFQHGGFFHATELRPTNSISATVKFFSRQNRAATLGPARLQLELLLGNAFDGSFGPATVQNFMSKIDAD